MSIRFEITGRSGTTRARTGVVHTPHGAFHTPAFMPVGTRGTVRGILPELVRGTGAEIILGNTYHLLLRPGPDVVEKLGGLQRFGGWGGPMLTDSGGYQAYSMSTINRVTDDGVTFKSIVDGRDIELTPERAISVQHQLGADIIMAFDDCPPSVDPEAGPINQTRLRMAAERDAAAADRIEAAAGGRRLKRPYDHPARLKLANERTVRWLERCRAEHLRLGGDRCALFGIVQGGTDLAQRSWSAERICGIDLPGYAIGGVAVGEQFADIARVVDHTAPLLPEHKPRYLMGVGYERDLYAAVRAGIDMFDCVLPTRNGRNANAFTARGQIRLRNSQYALDAQPIEPGCDCVACVGHPSESALSGVCAGFGRETGFSRAYIRHLFLAKEMLGPILVSLHNLRHFQRFMADLRRTVVNDEWGAFLHRWPVAAAPPEPEASE